MTGGVKKNEAWSAAFAWRAQGPEFDPSCAAGREGAEPATEIG